MVAARSVFSLPDDSGEYSNSFIIFDAEKSL